MLIQTIAMVLPVLVMLLIGMVCRQKNILTPEGLAGIRAVIGEIMLPLVLFNAFFTAAYGRSMLVIFLCTYCGFGLALCAGFLLRRLARPHERYLPFLVTSSEIGMLGYALYTLIAGAQNTSVLASVDIGQTVFSYTVWLTCLKIADGQKASVRDIVESFVHNKPAMGMLLGIIGGILGLGKLVLASPAAAVYTQAVSFISAPTGALILIVVGYDLTFSKELMKPVITTALLRIAVMGCMYLACSALIFRLLPYDKLLNMALMLACILPAPFVIPLFARHLDQDAGYVSTTYSVQTLAAIALFVPLVLYSLA